MTDKRTYDSVNAQTDTPTIGVGVRHSPTSTTSQGGGYLQNYTVFKPLDKKNERDPRLDELRQIGLHHTWQKIAEEIGFDNFLKMWRTLDSETQCQDARYGLLINLRRYKSYERYQRNCYILSCVSAGLKKTEISLKTSNAFREKIDKRYILNLVNRYKIKR